MAPIGLKLSSAFFGAETPVWSPFKWRGIDFKNPVGIAGGVDKNAEFVREWMRLGAGFVEIGTVTPRAQGPNPGTIILRDWDQKTLWNKMGFPNIGATEVAANLRALHDSPHRVPLFVNLGRNRDTPNAEAVADFIDVAERTSDYADVFVLNVSSPNTQGLRNLQTSDCLKMTVLEFKAWQKKTGRSQPLVVKLSPDLDLEQSKICLDVVVNAGGDGFILTNTTTRRRDKQKWPVDGGLSGLEVSDLALQALHSTVETLGKDYDGLIVSVGGVLSVDDIRERLKLGADLVQVYSALVFEGPLFFQKVGKEIGALHA